MESVAMACYVRERFAGGGARWLDAMWAGFGLAFLTKGPPALLPVLALLAFEASAPDRWARLRRVFARPLGLLAFALIGFTWFAVVIRRHPGLLDYFLGHEVYARIATAELRRFPEWYGPLITYLPTLLFGCLPWMVLAIPSIRVGIRDRIATWSLETRFLATWLALPLLVFCLARSRLPFYLLPLFAPLCLLLARALAKQRFTRAGVAWLAGWVLVLLGLKLAAALWISDKDGRLFTSELQPMLPGRPAEILFVEDMTRNGLNLYFDTDIERISFKPQPKMLSDSSYDRTVAEALRDERRPRVFIMKRDAERYFLDAVREGGKTPLRLGAIGDAKGRAERERVIYTLVGDFPAAPAAGH
jgi:hypothetical protein